MKTAHITTGNPDASQDGSSLWPYRVRNADDLDTIFRALRSPTTFILHPGTYFTKGCWAYPDSGWAMLPINSHIVGAHGSEATILRLADDYAEGEGEMAGQAVETVIGGGYGSGGSNQMVVTGLTIDNSAALARRRPNCGLHLWSGGCVVQDVVVRGVCGDWKTLVEGFAILISDSVTDRNGGNRVGHCRVEFDEAVQADLSYYNGIYIGSLTPYQAPNLIESCYVYAAVYPGVRRSHTAYACNENTTLRNCVGIGFERFLFCDTGNVGDVHIDGCRGDFAYCCVDLPAPVPLSPAPAIQYRRRIRMTHSTFLNNNPTSDHAIGILLQDWSNGSNQVSIEDIDVDGCRFVTALSPEKFYVCSIKAALTSKVWIRNSQFPPGCQTRAGVFSPTPSWEVLIEDVPAGSDHGNAQATKTA